MVGLAQEPGQETPCGVHPVGGLWPDPTGCTVHDLVGDLLAPVGGQAVQEQAWGPALSMSCPSTRNPSKSRSRRADSSSWPIDVQTSV